jgi:hypothetical protein
MQEKYSTIICDFLKSHPLISVNGLEETLNIPQSTVWKAVKNAREIPTKHIFTIICHLAGYGLQIDGFGLTYDQNDGILFARKAFEVKTKKDGEGFFYIVKEHRFIAGSFFDLL